MLQFPQSLRLDLPDALRPDFLETILDAPPGFGYTKSMKTAVSIPDDIFHEAETLAKELKTSRSDVYARALAAFVGDHSADRVTQAINAALDTVDGRPDPLIIAAANRTLRDVEW